MIRIAKGAVLLWMALAAASCVSTKKYNQMKAEAMRLDSERVRALGRVDELDGTRQRLETELRQLREQAEALSVKHRKLEKDYNDLISRNSAEASAMLRQLQENQAELEKREARMAELEQMLRNREAALSEIRRKVADALLGFEGKGLTVTQRGGNVYVSMEDKLLFRSGSFEIDPEGARAVRDLGQVLAQNPDINILVEGHTDNVPYRAQGQLRDNWDLSVKRATTVVRLLLENPDIAPGRITAAGRGEFFPLDTADTREARQKNRRTEINLTPKLDELMELMK